MDRHIENGTIVYWLKYSVNGYQIEYGIVEDHWSDAVSAERIVPRNRTTVDGVDIHDIHFPTKPKKLPKNWSYDMKMYETKNVLSDEDEERYSYAFSINDIKSLYDAGIFVKASEEPYWHGHIETVIEKGEWCLKYVYDDPRSNTVLKNWDEIFLSANDAQKRIDEINAENKRIANLSDYDYNVECLAKVIDSYKSLYHVPDVDIDKIRSKIMELDDFENLEFRLGSGNIQFKNWKKKRWVGVEI